MQMQAYEEFLRKNVPMIDFSQLSIERLDNNQCIVKMPFISQNKNHVQSMYFGSMLIGTEAAAGILALFHLEQAKQGPVLVFKDISGDFLKRAEADTYFICKDSEIIMNAVKESVETKQRVNAKLHVIGVLDVNNLDEKVSDFYLTISIKCSTHENTANTG